MRLSLAGLRCVEWRLGYRCSWVPDRCVAMAGTGLQVLGISLLVLGETDEQVMYKDGLFGSSVE